jgi:hypothetical protein
MIRSVSTALAPGWKKIPLPAAAKPLNKTTPGIWIFLFLNKLGMTKTKNPAIFRRAFCIFVFETSNVRGLSRRRLAKNRHPKRP